MLKGIVEQINDKQFTVLVPTYVDIYRYEIGVDVLPSDVDPGQAVGFEVEQGLITNCIKLDKDSHKEIAEMIAELLVNETI